MELSLIYKRKSGIGWLLLATLCFFACKKKDTAPDLPPFTTIITQGTWKVDLYAEGGVNKTSNFTGDIFQFFSGGTLSASHGGNVFNGSWSVISASQVFSFSINSFDVNLIALGGDWRVIAASNTQLQFVDGNDELRLVRL